MTEQIAFLRDGPAVQTQRQYIEALNHIDGMNPLIRRARLVEYGYPRHLYKYRRIPSAGDTAGRGQFESLLLENRLWLAAFRDFNDPFDGRADYEIPMRGHELRQTLERRVWQLTGRTSQQARQMVTSEMVAHPERLEAMLRENHAAILNSVGICSLSETPSNPLMWAHYSAEHRGICVQFRMALDPRALMAHPVEYSNIYPVVRNSFEPGDRRADLAILLRKSKDWEYEKEWRIVAVERASSVLQVTPRALTAIFLGLRCSTEDKDYVSELVEERQRRYGVAPTIFTAIPGRREYRVRFRKLR